MTLCPNERSAIYILCAFIWTYKKTFRFFIVQLYLVFNHPIFDIGNACFYRKNSTTNMLGKNIGFDLNVIGKQVDTKRMSVD